MERVKKGEKYWYIKTNNTHTKMWVVQEIEGMFPSTDVSRFESGNYFSTKEEAEAMARKLRAVLKGAEVIERWESEEVLNTLRVALSAEYGLTGLDSQREIDEKMAKTPETCLMRMLKESIEIISKIAK